MNDPCTTTSTEVVYKEHIKENPSTLRHGNTDWFVWRVEGFGIEESDARAAEAIEAGEKVTIITAPRSENARAVSTDTERSKERDAS